ncbi:adenylylsulfate kinase [Jatrophihabitans sp. GAS493]|uniref:adenylyl-sulfate kinase n=1 Tax=Jatrophihabitans sp. GAS493 TaxID=1907575 RepID=UPI000BB72622|nr:adenylyl-sulfate kinase [Jatrophihabitans sp. GAS493]SOD74346.1 adenylylsulfate kinase [Jatrophihabitans sp. GAS493]
MSLDAQTGFAPDGAVASGVRTTGATLWLTGLPSSGKTTVANALAARLTGRGVAVEILDGDAVRPVLSTELGYSREDRDLNVARIGWVAQRLSAHGVVTIASVVSPYAQARDAVRDAHRGAGVSFFEIHIATPVAVCEARDVKGLYGKQRNGGLLGLTGVDGSYEAPENPELRLDTSDRTVDGVVDELVALLQKERVL